MKPLTNPFLGFFTTVRNWDYISDSGVAHLNCAVAQSLPVDVRQYFTIGNPDCILYTTALPDHQSLKFISTCIEVAKKAGFRLICTSPSGDALFGREVDGKGEVVALQTWHMASPDRPFFEQEDGQIGFYQLPPQAIEAYLYPPTREKFQAKHDAYAWLLPGGMYQVLLAAYALSEEAFERCFFLDLDEMEDYANSPTPEILTQRLRDRCITDGAAIP